MFRGVCPGEMFRGARGRDLAHHRVGEVPGQHIIIAARPERFPEQWAPVFRRYCDPLKTRERVSDST
jgi:hypothetical protein